MQIADASSLAAVARRISSGLFAWDNENCSERVPFLSYDRRGLDERACSDEFGEGQTSLRG